MSPTPLNSYSLVTHPDGRMELMPFPSPNYVEYVVRPDGRVDYIADELAREAALSGSTRQRRASHVLPAAWLQRCWFRLLRRLFGEHGRVGSWTRTWKCEWVVDLRPSGGPNHWELFRNRADALACERQWLNEHTQNWPTR